MNERLLWTTGQQMRVEAGSPSGGGPKPKQWGVGAQGSPLTTLQSHTAQTTDRCREWRGSALWREQAESTPSPTGPWGPHTPPPPAAAHNRAQAYGLSLRAPSANPGAVTQAPLLFLLPDLRAPRVGHPPGRQAPGQRCRGSVPAGP